MDLTFNCEELDLITGEILHWFSGWQKVMYQGVTSLDILRYHTLYKCQVNTLLSKALVVETSQLGARCDPSTSLFYRGPTTQHPSAGDGWGLTAPSCSPPPPWGWQQARWEHLTGQHTVLPHRVTPPSPLKQVRHARHQLLCSSPCSSTLQRCSCRIQSRELSKNKIESSTCFGSICSDFEQSGITG